MFNINEFKSQGLPFAGARPTHFFVQIFPPFSSENTKRIQFACQSASLPAFIQEYVEVPYFGRRVKYPGDRVFQDWQVDIVNDADFAIRAIMERWHNELNALISNKMSEDLWPTRGKTTAEVTQLNGIGDPIRAYRFVGLFPTQISQIDLSYAATNQIESFVVNFAYDYYEPLVQSTTSDTYNPITPDDGNFNSIPIVAG